MKKPVLLLTCSAFVLASLMPAMPRPAVAEEGVAAGGYLTFSFGGDDQFTAEPQYGFRVGREVEGQPSIVPDTALAGTAYAPGQSIMDLRFNDQGPVALNFGGMDTLPYLGPKLGFHGDGDDAEQEEIEHWYIYGGLGGAALIVVLCAIAGCFGGGDEGHHDESK